MQINLNIEMPRTTLSAVQAELLDFMETLFVAVDLLNDNIDDFDDLAELMQGEELEKIWRWEYATKKRQSMIDFQTHVTILSFDLTF